MSQLRASPNHQAKEPRARCTVSLYSPLDAFTVWTLLMTMTMTIGIGLGAIPAPDFNTVRPAFADHT
jgi:hypothetical protein